MRFGLRQTVRQAVEKRARETRARGPRGVSARAIRTMLVCLMCLAGMTPARGQANAPATGEKPLMAEDVFKNVQVLRGIPLKEFMEMMGFFAASLNANCTTCHTQESGGNWQKYADDTDKIQTARKMILMVNTINKANFAGQRMVTCYSCHRNADRPKITPRLAEVYGAPPPDDPNEAESLGEDPDGPTADQVLDKYLQALGGPQRLASLTSFVGKGTFKGYDTAESPAEVFAKAPSQRATIAHTLGGERVTAYDGRQAWVAAPETDSPVPVLPLTGEDLEGAKFDADLSFPARIKQYLSNWRAGFALATINDRDVQVIEGKTAGGSVVKLFFDKESGLLVRQVRFTESPVGFMPTQVDYSDYRDVSGIKMPFHWTVTWLDGRTTIQLAEVQANAPVEPAKFAKPAPPSSKQTTQ